MVKAKSKKADVPANTLMRVYEIAYHILPTIDGAEVEKVVSEIRKILEDLGASFIAEGAHQRMPLSFPIAIWNNGKYTNYDHSHFGWIKCELNSTLLGTLEIALKAHKSVIRHLVFKTVREDMRAQVRQHVLKEVKRTDTIKSSPRRSEGESQGPVSEEKLDAAIDVLVSEV